MDAVISAVYHQGSCSDWLWSMKLVFELCGIRPLFIEHSGCAYMFGHKRSRVPDFKSRGNLFRLSTKSLLRWLMRGERGGVAVKAVEWRWTEEARREEWPLWTRSPADCPGKSQPH